MKSGLLLVTLGACSFQHGAYVSDSAGSAEGSADAPIQVTVDAAPPTACINKWLDGTVRLGSIDQVDAVNTTSLERDPFLTDDELTIYFSSNRTGNVNGDVYRATRGTKTSTFGTAMKFPNASTDGSDSKMAITGDGLYLVVASNKNGMSGSVDILDASRSSASDTFGPLGTTFTGTANTGADELDAFVTLDGLQLYFAQTINGFQRIARATRVSRTVPFSTGSVIAELDSGRGDADPTLSSDGRVILFSSMRTTDAGESSNIWYATRSSPTGTFGTPQPVPDVNEDSQEGDPWLSSDGCRLYFASDRENDYDIWSAQVQ